MFTYQNHLESLKKTDHGGPATEFLIQQAGEDPAICLFNYLPGDADAGGETFSF